MQRKKKKFCYMRWKLRLSENRGPSSFPPLPETALSLSFSLHFLFHLEPISPSCLVPRGKALLGALHIQENGWAHIQPRRTVGEERTQRKPWFWPSGTFLPYLTPINSFLLTKGSKRNNVMVCLMRRCWENCGAPQKCKPKRSQAIKL